MYKKLLEAEVLTNEEIAAGIFHLRMFAREAAAEARPGQFINIYPEAGRLVLPRPFGIAGAEPTDGTLDIVYEVVGAGTSELAARKHGDVLKISPPMGNGFDLSELENKEESGAPESAAPVIVGGGVGAAPLLFLTRTLKRGGTEPLIVLGFRKDVFLADEFRKLGCRVLVTTEVPDVRFFFGTVIDCMEANHVSSDCYFACGPRGMLAAVDEYVSEDCGDSHLQVSLEARMGCGYGVCVGCSINVLSEDEKGRLVRSHRKVCSDGPVFRGSEVIWHD